MSIYKELSYSKNDIDKVKGIQFCLLSPEDIIKRSVCEVNTTELFNLNEPAPNGLFDTRMGVLDHNHVCKTCEQKNTFCTGHFGHIVLAKPVFYPHFFDYIRKILHCVCFRCSKILVDINNPDIQAIKNKKISRQKKFDLIYKACSNVNRCGSKTTDGCGAKKPDKIAKDKDGIFRIIMEWKNLQGLPENANSIVNKQILNAEDVLRILRRISDTDIETLGFCTKFVRPEWMVCTVFPVPPPCVRPSVRNDTGQRSEDDLTHKLSSIVKINQALKAKLDKNATKEQYDIWTQVLQYDVSTLIDNNIPGLPPSHQRTGRPIKSISERLKGKEGRIRGNLMGKRVDFSARSVITPDPNISIEELGVPIKVAMNLTFPDIVNDITREELVKLVNVGPDVYPGAKYVIKTNDNNRKIRLRNVNRNQIADALENGDVVERHLRDGDYVLFNRQPSLHKMSMMAHKIVVMPYNTFRLNVCVTPSFNADFDGDEMNAHVPQSLQTQQELISLAAVPQQIMSPRDSSPIVSIVQDICTGVYRLTKNNVYLNEKQMFNILSPIIDGIKPIPKAQLLPGTDMERWSGKQLLSTIIPPNINVRTANKFFDERKADDSENYVIIENGEIIQGTLDKSIYQGRSKGLVHSIYNEYSPDDTRMFFDNTQQLICNWLVYSGFSTGISDLVVSSETAEKCNEIVKNMKVKVLDFIAKIHKGELDNKSTKNNADYFEQEVNNLLNRAAKQIGDMAASQVDDNDNRMINMIKAGAKGSEINFAQMIGCLGQQNVDGARIPYGFDDRTLPHFTKYDDGAEARGFVKNSFISGLSPQEFFFHAMGGREGLIDTAVKSITWETPIIITEHGVSKYVRIGEWIDYKLKASSADVEHYVEDRNLELLKLSSDVYIPTMNEDGDVTWGLVTDITRHDPGTRLYRIKTVSGRSVVVTESKSLLTWDTGLHKFKEVLTPDIKIGDCLPTTINLVEPVIITTHIDLVQFLPRTQYIHGSDLIKAIAVSETTSDALWWKEHNGVSFVLPPKKKSVVSRIPVDVLQEDMIYASYASRLHAPIAKQFELSGENGVMLGLYLSCGSIEGTSIVISNDDHFVKSFVREWFDRQCIYNKDTYKSVIGISDLHAQFFKKWAGRFSTKHVPDDAYIAPKEFVCGVLSGFMSSMDNVNITCDSVRNTHSTYSQRLLDGISMMCSRIGVFTTHLDNGIEINRYGVHVFLRHVEILHPIISEGVYDLHNSIDVTTPSNYIKDVFLDEIVHIETIGVEKHPKMYDLTIPSTLNFGLANGLQVRDTSSTGYVQRQLVKAMEDCKVHHDFTVRNASGSIIQFMYGEDGMDAVKIESQGVPYVSMTIDQIAEEFLIREKKVLVPVVDGNILDKIDETELQEKMRAHFQHILDDRKFLIEEINSCGNSSQILYPVNMQRIISSTQSMYSKHGSSAFLDLCPMYILENVEKLCSKLVVTKIAGPSRFLQMLLRAHLSPKKLIMKHRMCKDAFDLIVQQITQRFYSSMAHPGDMVGVVAAQSVGEPTTQLSAHGSTRILVQKRNGEFYNGSISKLIDNLIDDNPSKVIDIGHGSVVMDLDGSYSIVGVSNEEKTSWKAISQISRHPANGGMVRIHTKSGKTTCATLSHSFLKRVESGIEPVLGSDLKLGDRVPVARFIPTVEDALQSVTVDGWEIDLSMEYGWLCGAQLAGLKSMSPTTYIKMSENSLPGWVFAANLDFISGLLCGWLNNTNGNISVSSCDDAIILLAYLGVFTSKTDDGCLKIATKYAVILNKIGIKKSTMNKLITDEDNDMIPEIGCMLDSQLLNRESLREYIDTFHHTKNNKYMQMLRQAVDSDVVWDEIIHIEYLDDPKEFVYDFTVPGNDSFMVDTAVLVHNTLNSVEYSTPLLLKVDGELQRVQIGKFIEDEVAAAKLLGEDSKILEEHPNDTWLSWIHSTDIQVQSCDTHGKVSWRKVEAVTKHPVINKDGTNTILRVKMASGREVTATKAKSFLKRVDNEIIQVNGEDIVVGDRLPVSRVLSIDTNLLELDLSKYLPKKEWLYMSEVHKSYEFATEMGWWEAHNGQDFTLPYSEFPSFSTMLDSVKCHNYGNDCVYPRTAVDADTKVPEHIPLDEHFGFFIGSYIARGCVNNDAVSISGVENDNFMKLKKFLDMYSIPFTYKQSCTTNNTIKIYCTVLSDLLRTSFDANLPSELLAAPLLFLKEVINGYIFGHGILTTDRSVINTESDSLVLLETFQQMFTRFGTRTQIMTNNNESMRLIKCSFKKHTLTIPYSMFNDNNPSDLVPDVILSTTKFKSISRNDIPNIRFEYMKRLSLDDMNVLQRILDEDIVYDEVVSIEEVNNMHPYVYDLTVEGTRNFNTYTGICMADTFHSAGISSASKAVRGVPRLQELLNVTKKIKTPIMTIHVKPHFRTESSTKEEYKTKCLNILHELSTTRFKNIVSKAQIHYDPNDFDSKIEEDKRFIDMYRMFNDVTEQNVKVSPWLLRFEFDRQNMINIGINMIDLQNVLHGFYDDKVSCMFSDDNSSNLVMRVKLTTDSVESGEDMLAEIKALQHNIMENVIIKGIQGIEKISMRDQKSQHYGYDKNTHTFVQVNEWIMDTDGSNLREVMNSKYVDPYLTTTNNIFEIYEVLGIEAVRKALYNEIIEVLSGINVNYRHISLLIDTMANKGSIMPINRHGINRGDAGPLAKCSFEEVTDMLVSAGVFSDFDKINGVSANVMLGQIPSSGTGDGDIIMDEEILMKIISKLPDERMNFTGTNTEPDTSQCDFKIIMHVPKGLKTNEESKDLDVSFI